MVTPLDYLVPDVVSHDEKERVVRSAFPNAKEVRIEQMPLGCTNATYRATVDDTSYVMRIAYRPERIAGRILEKEADMLRMLERVDLKFSVPKVLWSGYTQQGLPVMIETYLPGTTLRVLLEESPAQIGDAAHTLGRFMAALHSGLRHTAVEEFESGRPAFPDFPSYARFYLAEWRPLCERVTYASREEIDRAYEIIEQGMGQFPEREFPYVHMDASIENLLGERVGDSVRLTGICDFENMQTGPAEMDLVTLQDTVFMFYPQMEQPFWEGYLKERVLPPNHAARYQAVGLFRILRYIKRTVKYQENHFAEVNSKRLRRWLDL